MNPLLKQKPFQIAALVLVLAVVCGFLVSRNTNTEQQTNVRLASAQIATAEEQLNHSHPGMERAETYLQSLKAINVSATPDDFKQAFHDYVDSLGNALDQVKSSRKIAASVDQEIAGKKAKLVEVTKKYLNNYSQ